MSEIREARLSKANSLIKKGVNPYAETFKITHSTKFISDKFNHLENGQEHQLDVSLAGRVLAKRVMGKIAFFTIHDHEGPIQLYLDKKIINSNQENQKKLSFDDLKEVVDIGDWIGVYGTIKKTNKGELSIKVTVWEMLSKSLKPLPDKWHGLTDIEKRYRQRYLDLIVNPHSKNVFKTRAKCISFIRRWLDERNFLEIETPILQSEPGGAEARPFITHHNTLDIPLYLRIATELHLKRMVVGGFDKVYELGRIFRNEGISTKHNPEFTSVEIYQAYSNYLDMMDLTEDLIKNIVYESCGSLIINYQKIKIDFSKPWKRISMKNIVKEYTGLDFDSFEGQTIADLLTDYALSRVKEMEAVGSGTPDVVGFPDHAQHCNASMKPHSSNIASVSGENYEMRDFPVVACVSLTTAHLKVVPPMLNRVISR